MRSSISLLRRSIGPIAFAMFGCSVADSVEPDPAAKPEPEPAPTSIVMISGNEQAGKIGAALSEPFVVRVTDSRGRGLNHIGVMWNVTSGAGYICFYVPDECHVGEYPVYTDADGYSRVWLRPALLGVITVVASLPVVRNSPVSFTATATPLDDVSGSSPTGRLAFSLWVDSQFYIYTM